MHPSSRHALLLAAALAGCTDDGDEPPPVVISEEWQSLVEGDWSLAPGEEGYYCVYATVPADARIVALRPLAPPGTHHTVLTTYTGSAPDGVVRCDAGTNGTTMIYGSGIGAPDFEFPAGVGLELAAGTRLLLNLHLYNVTDAPLTGRSGALFRTASRIDHAAEVVLAGPTFSLRVPPGVTTQSGTCQVSNLTDVPVQVFALSQHMHKLGRRLKTTVTRGGSSFDLQDIAYDFEKQEFHLVEPHVELRPGDVIETRCTFENMTNQTVGFGDSSDDEMCFSDLYYYPAQKANFICTL